MVSESQASQWPLIAGLRPRLRAHIRLYPQVYRGERWYVLRDQSNGRHLRFNASAYEFIGRLDGELSVQENRDQLVALLGDAAPSEDEILLILTQLFAIDALRSGLPSNAQEVFKRFQHDRRLRRQRALMNPLSIRFPLLDPDRVLNRLMPWVRPVFSWSGCILWVLVVGFAGLLALTNLPALGAALDQDILRPTNLLSMMLVFSSIKLIHEFAHAFAVKLWGGEVHEMGITLLVLMPVPYVDASAAWGFRDKYKRILVGAAGILAELFVAALALFACLMVEPGLFRDAAFNAVLIASVSTLLFNANPLLRYDGYYILQDLIEIPNLYTRSSRYYLYLIQRYLFGLAQVRSPVTAAGESVWFAVYGLAAFFYRLFILTVIVLFLAKKYLFVGVALASWAVVTGLILPLVRGLRFLVGGGALAGRRFRAIAISVLMVGGVSTGVLLLPLPLATRAAGVVWVSDQAQLYAGADGFVDQILVAPGTQVAAGTSLVQMRNPSLRTRIAVLQARQRELDIRRAAELIAQRVQSDITQQELASVEAELRLAREQSAALLIRSQVAGRFVLLEQRTMKGRYLHQGQLLGYIISPQRLIVRTVVTQSDIGLVRKQVRQVGVRFAERLDEPVDVRILRETPAGTTRLPSPALGAAGGGEIAIKKGDEGGATAADKVFQVDLGLPENLAITGVGERVYVRFDHGSEPLASQWLRSGRQLLLSRLTL